MNEDDDLPVLTQVLVTASGQAAVPVIADGVAWATSHDGRVEPTLPRALVIGSDPDSPDATVTASSLAGVRDAFSVTAPGDYDGRIDQSSFASDDPLDDELHVAEAFATAAPSTSPPPLSVFSRPPAEAAHDGGVAGIAADAGLAVTVRDDVLSQLGARIDTELDARIAERLRIEVESAIGQLQTRLRAELGFALRDVVGRAVDDAIARRRGGDA